METKKTRNRKKFQKNYLIILVILLFISIVIFITVNISKNQSTETKIITHVRTETVVNIEIAKTEEERIKGLMGRDNLEKNQGMLFIFEDSDYRTFWMKNTPQSLDMIFLDKNLRVINFYANTSPNQTERKYSSRRPAKYVLEVKSGFIKDVRLRVNDYFKLKN